MSDALKRILRNLLIFAVILAVLIVIVLTALKKYTHHDSVITVPDVTSLTVDDAAPFFDKKNLRYKVVDSIRVVTQLPGAILEQKPAPGAHVKENRIIFLTINASSEERMVIPDVKDCSQRQAVATLEASGIRVRDIEFIPSEFRDLVLGIRFNGKDIPAGYKLPKGSSVTLLVGQSSSQGELAVPSMHGLFLQEAIETAHSKSLSIGNVYYDVTPANAEVAKNYQIYKQDPITGTSISVGKKVDVWMSTDPKLIDAPDDVFLPEDSLNTEQ
ncbi:MAG: PASTA domain-containing protein [Bacteroidales bacterium]|nr:PASTA domain-containing protein [Bacteroidales bacterium]